jgi:tetratricopeptide (TPR) repeat protein
MWYDYDFPTAEREFERSLELNPRSVTGHTWFGFFLAMMGRNEEAYTEVKRAIRLDPCSSPVYFCLGIVHWAARLYDQAIEQFEKAIEKPLKTHPRTYRNDTIMARILSEPPGSFWPSPSFCGCTMFWRGTGSFYDKRVRKIDLCLYCRLFYPLINSSCAVMGCLHQENKQKAGPTDS